MNFQQRQGDPAASVSVLPPVNGYDELGAKRVERELVDLGAHLGELQSSLALLAGALDEPPCSELLARMEQGASDLQGDLSRLMCEAKRLVRGE